VLYDVNLTTPQVRCHEHHINMAHKTIALIISSTRKPRICPSIATWLISLIIPLLGATPNIKFITLDLASYRLPLSPCGPAIPAKLSLPLAPAPYEDPGVDSWSQAIRGVDAFIFLTPQYNWGIPGALKVALDHLFHEWSGKPMMLVTYGGHGGGRCAVHLREVWKGLRGGECVGGVELVLSGEGMGMAQREGVLDEKTREAWVEAGKDKEVLEGWGRLAEVLGGEKL
jgi:NAD(P)H-dependent FMN reductase